jgi:hypothetical protein
MSYGEDQEDNWHLAKTEREDTGWRAEGDILAIASRMLEQLRDIWRRSRTA